MTITFWKTWRTHSIYMCSFQLWDANTSYNIFKKMPRTGKTAAMRSPKPHCCTVKRILIAIGSTTSPTVCSIQIKYKSTQKLIYLPSPNIFKSNASTVSHGFLLPSLDDNGRTCSLGSSFTSTCWWKPYHPAVHIYLGGKNGWTCYIVIYCGYLDGLLICWAW